VLRRNRREKVQLQQCVDEHDQEFGALRIGDLLAQDRDEALEQRSDVRGDVDREAPNRVERHRN
jgi:hypothetical protein